jgi:hypothetical protein
VPRGVFASRTGNASGWRRKHGEVGDRERRGKFPCGRCVPGLNVHTRRGPRHAAPIVVAGVRIAEKPQLLGATSLRNLANCSCTSGYDGRETCAS